MSSVVTLCRPTSAEEVKQYMTALAAGLDDIGVGPGDWFTIFAGQVDPATGRRSYAVPDARAASAVAGKRDTSRAAAKLVTPRTGTQRYRVIQAVLGFAMTRDEISEATGIAPNSLRPRVLEAIDGGWLRVATEERDSMEVIEITEKGRDLVTGTVAA